MHNAINCIMINLIGIKQMAQSTIKRNLAKDPYSTLELKIRNQKMQYIADYLNTDVETLFESSLNGVSILNL